MSKKPFGLAVKGVVRDENGRILFLRRSASSKWFPGKWELPGGKVDTGEPVDHALVREVREEIGLEVSVEKFLGATGYDMPHVHVILLYFECTKTSGKAKLSDEHQEVQWVVAEDIPSLDKSEQLTPFFAAWKP